MLGKFSSRKFLLALVGQITGLIVLLVPEHTDQITAASSNVGALLLMALTAMGFIKGEAMIDAASVQGEREIERTEAQADAEIKVSTETRKAAMAAKNMTGILAILILQGCTTSPGGYPIESAKGIYDASQSSFIELQKFFLTAKQIGSISQEDYDNKVMPLMRAGNETLDDMLPAALADDISTVQLLEVSLQSVLRQLITLRLQTESKGQVYEGNDPDLAGDPLSVRSRQANRGTGWAGHPRQVPGGRVEGSPRNDAAHGTGIGEAFTRKSHAGWLAERSTWAGPPPRKLTAPRNASAGRPRYIRAHC